MSKCYIVTEGLADAALLSPLLADAVPVDAVKIVQAGGRSSAVSLARTLLVTRSASVALLVDADTTHPDRVSEMRVELEDSLGVAPRSRFGVFLAVPSLEICLFQDEAGLRSEFGDALSPELIVQSRYEPKTVITQLMQRRNQPTQPASPASLLPLLDHDLLRKTPVIRDLVQFVSAAARAAPA